MEPVSAAIITVTARRPPPDRATPADGGPPLGPDEAMPQPANFTFDDVLRGLNPLHHLPVVGTIYRAVSGETIPPSERIAGSILAGALFGGPLGVLATVVICFVEELIRIGPDPRQPRWGEVPITAEARPGDIDLKGSG